MTVAADARDAMEALKARTDTATPVVRMKDTANLLNTRFDRLTVLIDTALEEAKGLTATLESVYAYVGSGSSWTNLYLDVLKAFRDSDWQTYPSGFSPSVLSSSVWSLILRTSLLGSWKVSSDKFALGEPNPEFVPESWFTELESWESEDAAPFDISWLE
jgi:hypothetical protein